MTHPRVDLEQKYSVASLSENKPFPVETVVPNEDQIQAQRFFARQVMKNPFYAGRLKGQVYFRSGSQRAGRLWTGADGEGEDNQFLQGMQFDYKVRDNTTRSLLNPYYFHVHNLGVPDAFYTFNIFYFEFDRLTGASLDVEVIPFKIEATGYVIYKSKSRIVYSSLEELIEKEIAELNLDKSIRTAHFLKTHGLTFEYCKNSFILSRVTHLLKTDHPEVSMNADFLKVAYSVGNKTFDQEILKQIREFFAAFRADNKITHFNFDCYSELNPIIRRMLWAVIRKSNINTISFSKDCLLNLNEELQTEMGENLKRTNVQCLDLSKQGLSDKHLTLLNYLTTSLFLTNIKMDDNAIPAQTKLAIEKRCKQNKNYAHAFVAIQGLANKMPPSYLTEIVRQEIVENADIKFDLHIKNLIRKVQIIQTNIRAGSRISDLKEYEQLEKELVQYFDELQYPVVKETKSEPLQASLSSNYHLNVVHFNQETKCAVEKIKFNPTQHLQLCRQISQTVFDSFTFINQKNLSDSVECHRALGMVALSLLDTQVSELHFGKSTLNEFGHYYGFFSLIELLRNIKLNKLVIESDNICPKDNVNRLEVIFEAINDNACINEFCFYDNISKYSSDQLFIFLSFLSTSHFSRLKISGSAFNDLTYDGFRQFCRSLSSLKLESLDLSDNHFPESHEIFELFISIVISIAQVKEFNLKNKRFSELSDSCFNRFLTAVKNNPYIEKIHIDLSPERQEKLTAILNHRTQESYVQLDMKWNGAGLKLFSNVIYKNSTKRSEARNLVRLACQSLEEKYHMPVYVEELTDRMFDSDLLFQNKMRIDFSFIMSTLQCYAKGKPSKIYPDWLRGSFFIKPHEKLDDCFVLGIYVYKSNLSRSDYTGTADVDLELFKIKDNQFVVCDCLEGSKPYEETDEIFSTLEELVDSKFKSYVVENRDPLIIDNTMVVPLQHLKEKEETVMGMRIKFEMDLNARNFVRRACLELLRKYGLHIDVAKLPGHTPAERLAFAFSWKGKSEISPEWVKESFYIKYSDKFKGGHFVLGIYQSDSNGSHDKVAIDLEPFLIIKNQLFISENQKEPCFTKQISMEDLITRAFEKHKLEIDPLARRAMMALI